MSKDSILTAFQALDIQPPADNQICIYKSGLVDSADLMQLLLEIEMETSKRLDLSTLMDGDITLARLRETLAGAT
jgi:acyl carrier protein